MNQMRKPLSSELAGTEGRGRWNARSQRGVPRRILFPLFLKRLLLWMVAFSVDFLIFLLLPGTVASGSNTLNIVLNVIVFIGRTFTGCWSSYVIRVS